MGHSPGVFWILTDSNTVYIHKLRIEFSNRCREVVIQMHSQEKERKSQTPQPINNTSSKHHEARIAREREKASYAVASALSSASRM
jgi:hypothetical protein